MLVQHRAAKNMIFLAAHLFNLEELYDPAKDSMVEKQWPSDSTVNCREMDQIHDNWHHLASKWHQTCIRPILAC